MLSLPVVQVMAMLNKLPIQVVNLRQMRMLTISTMNDNECNVGWPYTISDDGEYEAVDAMTLTADSPGTQRCNVRNCVVMLKIKTTVAQAADCPRSAFPVDLELLA